MDSLRGGKFLGIHESPRQSGKPRWDPDSPDSEALQPPLGLQSSLSLCSAGSGFFGSLAAEGISVF